jgi:uncharacterized membrane protein
MNEWIAVHTSLPNLHPALVHLPIALVPLAALLDLAAAGRAKARGWLARAGALVWTVAALSAGATYWAGRQAADSLAGVDPQVQAWIGTHSDWGRYTLWAVGLLAAGRVVFWLRRPEHRGALALGGLLGLGATALGLQTAELGGSLVYEHAVAVRAPAPAAHAVEAPDAPLSTPAPSAGPPETRLERTDEGGLTWRPLPEDGAALGTVLEPLAGEAAVRVSSSVAGGREGLSLTVAGRTLLALPGSFGDVQVEAELEPVGFEGTVGLSHHVQGPERAGLLRVTLPGGELALVTLRPDARPKVLDSGRRALPDGPVQLGVYAAGRHLRGMIGGETVVHGHEPALPDGRVGLLLDGRGELTIRSIKVIPIRHGRTGGGER